MTVSVIPSGNIRAPISKITALDFPDVVTPVHVRWLTGNSEGREAYVVTLAQQNHKLMLRIPAGSTAVWANPMTDAIKQSILDNLDGQPASAQGFNVVMRDTRSVANVQRLNDKEVTIDFGTSALTLDQNTETVSLAEQSSWFEEEGAPISSSLFDELTEQEETVEIIDAPFWKEVFSGRNAFVGQDAVTSRIFPWSGSIINLDPSERDGPPPSGWENPPHQPWDNATVSNSLTPSSFAYISAADALAVGGIQNVITGVVASTDTGPVLNMANIPNWIGPLGQGPNWTNRYCPIVIAADQYVQGYAMAQFFNDAWLISWNFWYWLAQGTTFFPGSDGIWGGGAGRTRIWPKGWKG